MKNIIVVALLLVYGFAHSQIASFRVTDVDNLVINNAEITVDDTLVKYADCMGHADLNLNSGMHSLKISHPSFFDYQDSINVTTDVTIIAKLNPKWYMAQFIVKRDTQEAGLFRIRCGGVTTGSNGSKAVIMLKPGKYWYDVYTEFDTNSYSMIVSNDTTLNVQLPVFPVKNDTTYEETLSIGCSGTLIGSEAEDTIFVMDMSGKIVNVYDVKTTPAEMIATDLSPGLYIIIAYSADKTKLPRTYKIAISQ